MAEFQPLDLGRVIQTAEALRGMRRQGALDELQTQYMRGNMARADTQEQRASAQEGRASAQENRQAQDWSQEHQLANTRYLNMAAAEVAKNPQAAARWEPVLKGIDPNFTWGADPSASAKQIYESTTAALQAHQQNGTTGTILSTRVLENGNIANVYRDGRIVDTGMRAQPQNFQFETVQLSDGRTIQATRDQTTGALYDANGAQLSGPIRGAAPGGAPGGATPAQPGLGQGRTPEAAASAKTLAEENAKRFSTQIDEGYRAADGIPVINRGLELLDSVKTGGVNAAALAASNFFGVTGADEAELSNNLGKAVLAQLRSTFGAQFTAAEGQRLSDLEAGFGKSTAGNRRILEQARVLVQRVAERGINAAMQTNNQYDADGIRAAMKLNLGQQPQQQQSPGGGAPGGQQVGRFSVQIVK